MPTKQYSNKEVELKDTTNLQMASLMMFANKFGYKYSGNGNFIGINKKAVRLSLATIQKLHNKVNSVQPDPNHALVKKTKLQWSKKDRKLIVVDHQIEFI